MHKRRFKPLQIEVRTYRDSQLEILDDRGEGWLVIIHTSKTPKRIILRNRVPHGLAPLLEEAQTYVDRRLGFGTQPDYP